MDDITVLVRTRDRPQMLDAALRSAADQDCRMVAAVDPCADRQTYDVLDGHDVDVVRCERRGLGAAWNEGMECIKSGYVYVLDDDDTLMPNAISTMRRFIESEAEAPTSLMSFRPLVRYQHGEARPAPRVIPYDFNRLTHDKRYRLLLSDRGPRGNYLYHTDTFGMVGPVPEDMPVYEDYALALRSGGRLLYGDDPVLVYRIHGSNATGQGMRTWREAAALRVSLELRYASRRQLVLASWLLPRRKRSAALAFYRMLGGMLCA